MATAANMALVYITEMVEQGAMTINRAELSTSADGRGSTGTGNESLIRLPNYGKKFP
jgi:hypothetical protein